MSSPVTPVAVAAQPSASPTAAASLSRDELLHEIFAATARRAPDRVAVRWGAHLLSYAGLQERAGLIAGRLRGLGLGRGDRVLVWLPRGPDMYAAQLGILAAGATYVPLDPDTPRDRAAFIAKDCGARAVISLPPQADEARHLPCPLINLTDRGQTPEGRGQTSASANKQGEKADPLDGVGAAWPDRAATGATPDDCAYIIYTSGTTGRPKGVMISHRSICHLVRSEGTVLGLRESDLVFQGFSLSFDMSLEEIWPAWAAGATLLCGTTDMIRAGGDLAGLLAAAGVTVWSCVPTLLAMQEGDVPSLRLLNLGGEACPPDLVRRWHRPGRRILNTYGPTETTITATYAECEPGRPITIGRPLPGYHVVLLGEDRGPVAPGQSGELCIGGLGVALGYVGRPELDQEKFPPDPASPGGGRLYRSGDLARLTPEGELEFLGRIDTQVKIRGYRVELAEIESVLLECPGVRSAAVQMYRDATGVEVLAAHVVARDGSKLDPRELRNRLRTRLPVYMVPSVIEPLAALPLLPSGKVDRQRLPPPGGRALPGGAAPARAATGRDAATAAERRLLAVWNKLFEAGVESVNQDFFTDLGGHSLLAAALVSRLRKEPDFRHVSMLDLYQHPTIRRLAVRLEQARPAPAPAGTGAAQPAFTPTPPQRYWLCATLQAVALFVLYGIAALEVSVPFLAYSWLVNHGSVVPVALAGAMGILFGLLGLMPFIAILGKWLVLPQARPGEYPLWGAYYFRWWLAQRIMDTVPADYLCGTTLARRFFRLLGAKIGANVHLGSDLIDMPDLVTIGDDVVLSAGAMLICSRVEDGRLKLAPIVLENGAFVGAGSLVAGGATLGAEAHLGDLSLLPRGAAIPPGELWLGSPARPHGAAPRRRHPRPSAETEANAELFYLLLAPVFALFALLPIAPGLVILNLAVFGESWRFLWWSPVAALLYVVFMCLEIAAMKWVLLERVAPGRHALHSRAYIEHWFVDRLMEMSLDVVKPLYASLYLNPWYRLLGVKLGPRAEVSTASAIGYDLLTIGEEGFIADAVLLGPPRVWDNEFILEPTTVGRRAFVGNSALVPAGTVLGDEVLVGCLSVPPASAADADRFDSSWFGSPAVFLPSRQKSAAFGEGATFKPTPWLYAQRLAIEAVRVILPMTVIITVNSCLLMTALKFEAIFDTWQILVIFPALYLWLVAAAALLVVALKWLVIGVYRPVERPLWSRFVWRSELVTSTYENLAVPFAAEMMRGTPFLNVYLRLLGCRIGKRVFTDTTDITEFDVVKVGDEAALNAACGLQTHLFEDRVMKISRVQIGTRAVVGSLAIVLYDSKMEEGARLDDLSMLMKGETLPAGTSWRGSPAQPVAG
jgi:non-ribosomal peptide synthetase-like protein